VATFGDGTKAVETQLHVRAFVVVEQAPGTEHHFLAPGPQAYAVPTANVRTDLYERLMNITAVFVDSRPWATVPPVGVIKLEFGKQAQVNARVEIEMGHRPVHDVAIVVLRTGAKHPVFEILVFDTVFESQREVQLWVFAKPNVLCLVEKVSTLRRVCEKIPILLGRK
jgi:hypothetical protein